MSPSADRGRNRERNADPQAGTNPREDGSRPMSPPEKGRRNRERNADPRAGTSPREDGSRSMSPPEKGRRDAERPMNPPAGRHPYRLGARITNPPTYHNPNKERRPRRRGQWIMGPPPDKPVPVIPESCPVNFPPENEWHESGLVAVGGDLTSRRLVQAYSQGIFPWYTDDMPILWWSPDPRCVLFTKALHIPRSLAKSMRRSPFSFTINQAFTEVILNCAKIQRPGQQGTWITPSMIAAYLGMHRQGLAHSVECWEGRELVGGVYGVALGRIFFGESMFHIRPDASKAALVTLVRCMKDQGFLLLDCQQATPHMLRLGAREIPRYRFLDIVREHAQIDPEGTEPTFSDVIPNME